MSRLFREVLEVIRSAVIPVLLALLVTFPQGSRSSQTARPPREIELPPVVVHLDEPQVVCGDQGYSHADFAPTADYVERPYGLRSYDGRTRTLRWVLERLTSENRRGDRAGLTFHASPDTPKEFRAAPANYALSGQELGHGAAAGNWGATPELLRSTFETENAMPQTHGLNGGPWRVDEEFVFEFAHAPGVKEVWVLSAPAWLGEETEASQRAPQSGTIRVRTIGPDHVWVPTHCVKSALIVFENGKLDLRSWKFANSASPAAPKEARITTDQAERDLGLDLWAGLPDEIENRLEAAQP